MAELKDRLELNIPDTSAFEFQNALMSALESELASFSTHAMSNHALFLQGQKDMLRQVIEYIDKI